MRGLSNNFRKYLKNIISFNRPEIWLIFILIFALCLRLYFFVGLNWSDDPGYVSDAYRVLKGDFYLGKYLAGERLMMIYPIAFLFFLFGINNFSAALYPLLSSLGSIVIIFYLGKLLFDEKSGLLSAFLLSIFPLNITYATWPMPDVPVAFLSALVVLLFLKAKNLKDRELNKKRILFLLSGILIGISYLNKVSGAIILLFLVPYILYDTIKKRKIDWDYSFLFLGFVLILLFEGTFYFINNGDFFTRYRTVSEFYVPGRAGINSDLKFYPEIMFNLSHNLSFNWGNLYFVHYGLFYYFILISFIYILIKRDKKSFIPFLWFVLLFLYLEFGSMSYTQYVPIHKLPRHLTVITIPALLCLSYFLTDMVKGKYPQRKKILFVAVVGFILISSVLYTKFTSDYLKASTFDMKEIYKYLKDYPDKNIYCDIGTLSHLRFYFGFKNDEHIKDLSFVKNVKELRDSFVILNGSRGVVENTLGSNNIPNFTRSPSSNWKLMKTIKGPKIDIWGSYDPKIYYVT